MSRKEIERGLRRSANGLFRAAETDSAPLTRAFEYFLSEVAVDRCTYLGMPAALAQLAEAVGHASTIPSQGLPPVTIPSRRSGGVAKRVAIAAAVVIGVGGCGGDGSSFFGRPVAAVGKRRRWRR